MIDLNFAETLANTHKYNRNCFSFVVTILLVIYVAWISNISYSIGQEVIIYIALIIFTTIAINHATKTVSAQVSMTKGADLEIIQLNSNDLPEEKHAIAILKKEILKIRYNSIEQSVLLFSDITTLEKWEQLSKSLCVEQLVNIEIAYDKRTNILIYINLKREAEAV